VIKKNGTVNVDSDEKGQNKKWQRYENYLFNGDGKKDVLKLDKEMINPYGICSPNKD
jgi:hypothetical protein